MSAAEPQANAAESAEPVKKSSLTTILAAAGCLVAGVGIGLFVVGPKLSGGASKPAEEAAAGESESGGEGHGKEPKGEGRLVRVDNVVVNPAGSEGLRFLMVSVAFELHDEAAEAKLSSNEVQVRDAVTGVFEKQTMAQLTQPGARDSLKKELANAMHPIIGSAKVRVYLPQFVIQ